MASSSFLNAATLRYARGRVPPTAEAVTDQILDYPAAELDICHQRLAQRNGQGDVVAQVQAIANDLAKKYSTPDEVFPLFRTVTTQAGATIYLLPPLQHSVALTEKPAWVRGEQPATLLDYTGKLKFLNCAFIVTLRLLIQFRVGQSLADQSRSYPSHPPPNFQTEFRDLGRMVAALPTLTRPQLTQYYSAFTWFGRQALHEFDPLIYVNPTLETEVEISDVLKIALAGSPSLSFTRTSFSRCRSAQQVDELPDAAATVIAHTNRVEKPLSSRTDLAARLERAFGFQNTTDRTFRHRYLKFDASGSGIEVNHCVIRDRLPSRLLLLDGWDTASLIRGAPDIDEVEKPEYDPPCSDLDAKIEGYGTIPGACGGLLSFHAFIAGPPRSIVNVVGFISAIVFHESQSHFTVAFRPTIEKPKSWRFFNGGNKEKFTLQTSHMIAKTKGPACVYVMDICSVTPTGESW